MKTIPLTILPDTEGRDIYGSLSSFWRTLFEDKAVIRDYTKGSGLVAAQVFLNFLETVNNLSRNDMPIFHRERWMPIIIRRSERNQGKAIIAGQEPPLFVGPQPDDTAYDPLVVYPVGGSVSLGGAASYQINSTFTVKDGVISISDSPVAPTTTFIKNTHFTVSDGLLVFREDSDPFEFSSFPRRLIGDAAAGDEDEELVLWASDVLIDKFFVRDNFGYQIGLDEESTEQYRANVNALLDLQFGGPNLTLLQTAIGTLTGVPVIRSTPEVVEVIVDNDDGTRDIITDMNVYSVTVNDEIREPVIPGASFNAGDLLTEGVKLYPRLDPDRFLAANGLPLSEFLVDVPALFLPKGIMGDYGGASGFIVKWEEQPLTFEGNDSNGNPRLRFALGGTEEDADAFWQSTWDRATADNTSLADFFSEFLFLQPPYITVGATVGFINPLKFFMQNFLKTNVGVLVVDFNALPEHIKSLDTLGRLADLLPAHALLLIIGSQNVSEEPYDLAVSAAESLSSTYGKRVRDDYSGAKDGGVLYRWVSI